MLRKNKDKFRDELRKAFENFKKILIPWPEGKEEHLLLGEEGIELLHEVANFDAAIVAWTLYYIEHGKIFKYKEFVLTSDCLIKNDNEIENMIRPFKPTNSYQKDFLGEIIAYKRELDKITRILLKILKESERAQSKESMKPSKVEK